MTIPMQSTQALMETIQSLPIDKIAEVASFVEVLKQQTKSQSKEATDQVPLDFPVDDLGAWPEGLSLSREDMYNDDGR